MLPLRFRWKEGMATDRQNYRLSKLSQVADRIEIEMFHRVRGYREAGGQKDLGRRMRQP